MRFSHPSQSSSPAAFSQPAELKATRTPQCFHTNVASDHRPLLHADLARTAMDRAVTPTETAKKNVNGDACHPIQGFVRSSRRAINLATSPKTKNSNACRFTVTTTITPLNLDGTHQSVHNCRMSTTHLHPTKQLVIDIAVLCAAFALSIFLKTAGPFVTCAVAFFAVKNRTTSQSSGQPPAPPAPPNAQTEPPPTPPNSKNNEYVASFAILATSLLAYLGLNNTHKNA